MSRGDAQKGAFHFGGELFFCSRRIAKSAAHCRIWQSGRSVFSWAATELKYTLNNNEMNIGIQAIAAPIHSHAGYVTATLGIAMPVGRMTVGEMENQLAAVVKEYADKISAALGYGGEGR